MYISEVEIGDVLVNSSGLEYVVVENDTGLGNVAYSWISRDFYSNTIMTQRARYDKLNWVVSIRRGGDTFSSEGVRKFNLGDIVKTPSGSTGVVVNENGYAMVRVYLSESTHLFRPSELTPA